MHRASVVRDLVQDAWSQYAVPRFRMGTQRERREWARFTLCTTEIYLRLRDRAKQNHHALDFDQARLQLYVLRTLDAPCQYCGKYFGVDSFGVTYLQPPARWIDGDARAHSLGNLAACCDVCDAAKGTMSASEWIEQRAVLNTCDQRAASDLLNAILKGRGHGELSRKGIEVEARGRYASAAALAEEAGVGDPTPEGTSDGVPGCE